MMTLCRIDCVRGKNIGVYMEAITEEQEKQIDSSVKRHNKLFFRHPNGTIIEGKDIYLYGEVNLNNEEDISQIERFNLIDDDGSYMYSNFDYDSGTFTTINRVVKFFPTWDCVKWFMYCYCLIGKPQRIIVYRSVPTKK